MKDFEKESLLENIQKAGVESLADRLRIQKKTNELTRQNDQYANLLKRKEGSLRTYCIASESNELLKKLDQKIFSTFYQEGGILFFAKQLQRYTDEILTDTATLEEMWVGGYTSAIQRISKDLLALEVACRLTEENMFLAVRDNGKTLSSVEQEKDNTEFTSLQMIHSLAEDIDYARSLGLNSTVVTMRRKRTGEVPC